VNRNEKNHIIDHKWLWSQGRASRKKGKFEGRVCKRDGACGSGPILAKISGAKKAHRATTLPSPLLSSPSIPCCDSALLLFAGDERKSRGSHSSLFHHLFCPLFLSPGSEPAKPHEAHFPLYTNRGGTGEREREGESTRPRLGAPVSYCFPFHVDHGYLPALPLSQDSFFLPM
jgi:hypothetical protein